MGSAKMMHGLLALLSLGALIYGIYVMSRVDFITIFFPWYVWLATIGGGLVFLYTASNILRK